MQHHHKSVARRLRSLAGFVASALALVFAVALVVPGSAADRARRRSLTNYHHNHDDNDDDTDDDTPRRHRAAPGEHTTVDDGAAGSGGADPPAGPCDLDHAAAPAASGCRADTAGSGRTCG